ncbi:MAG: T9SS type A sorting domain-containing protein [Bacteroidetes bacterium]|nr:MAG: T9SS type A sorting domain-containing protein [Bacteroidota bacterium]
MKTFRLLTFTAIIILTSIRAQGQPTVFKHQIFADDVTELNKLGTALGINGLNGWPVSAEEMNGNMASVAGVEFITVDTTSRQNGDQKIIVYHMKVKTINLNSRGLSGTLPSLSFSELISFNLANNNISGPIPQFTFPKCTDLILYRNKISGNIPILNLPELLQLNLLVNQLTGPIPAIWPDKLVSLFLSDNQLTGPLPALNLPNLKYFFASRNQLTGNIPNFGFPQLETLELEENNLTGTIPPFSFPMAQNIRLSANQLTGTIPAFNMPELSNLALGDNQLSDELPKFNMPKLILLNVKDNQIEGSFDNSGLPKLYFLYIQNNNFTELPDLKGNSPDFTGADVRGNKFTFEDLEPNMNIGAQFLYNSQQRVPVTVVQQGANIKVGVNVGGTRNTYQWYKYLNGKGALIDGATQSELITPLESGAEYYCIVKNALVSGMSIYSERSKLSNCREIAGFDFCVDSGQWDGVVGTSKITTTNTVVINAFLVFTGTMTIDTLAYTVSANGAFYIDNIPIPGGTTGKYSIATGEFNLSLSEDDEKIKNFLNAGLSYSAELFGMKMKIEELQFFVRHDTVGINLGCSAHIPWASTGCGVLGIYEPGADLKLKSLEITNKGILNVAFEAENIGLFKKDYCIKNITYEYDWVNDVLVEGGQIALPFLAEIGGGVRIEKGFIDSVSWSVEGGSNALLKPLPLGFGTLGIKGCYGHIAGLNESANINPYNLDVHLGGIFSDIKTDDLYKITGDARINWPKIFEINGSLQALKPHEDLPFQIQGDARATYQVSDNLLELAYNGKFLTADEQTWLATGGGSLTVHFKEDNTNAETDFTGEINIPKLGDYWPFTWFSSYTFGTYMISFSENPNLVHGVLYYYPASESGTLSNLLFKINYIVDTKKQIYESGYLTFPETSRVDVSVAVTKSAVADNMLTGTISVPENSRFSVFEIKSPGQAPVSSVTSPAGKTFTATSAADSILYTQTDDGKSAFWSILSPKAGEWQITLENPQNGDSVISHFQMKTPDFSFLVNQTGNTVNLTWEPALTDDAQTINFLFDTDNSGFDGFKVLTASSSSGSASLTLDENYPRCSYYVYAQVIGSSGVAEVYAAGKIENPSTILAAPTNIVSGYNSQTGLIDIRWTPSSSPETDGYIISVIDSEGNDSVFVIPDKNATGVSLSIEDYRNKYAVVETYNAEGTTGCPYILPSLITSLNDRNLPGKQLPEILVYPNPANGKVRIRFTQENDGFSEIKVFDFTGRTVALILSEKYPAGTWEKDFDFGNLPGGMYFFVLKSGNSQTTVKCVLNRIN